MPCGRCPAPTTLTSEASTITTRRSSGSTAPSATPPASWLASAPSGLCCPWIRTGRPRWVRHAQPPSARSKCKHQQRSRGAKETAVVPPEHKEVSAMKNTLPLVGLVVCYVTLWSISPAAAQDSPAKTVATPKTARLTLDEVKQRVLADNKLLQLAGLNVQSKGYAARAVQANYFPQIIGHSVYLHFNDDL